MYDCSIFNHKPTVYVITDLEACYDWQLSNICGIVEGSLGISRKRIKLIAKVMPVLKHRICTRFGISSILYGSPSQQIAGTGQGNRFLGDRSRDTSYYIIKEVENEKLGVAMRLLIKNKSIQRTTITFIDDTNFYTNRKQYVAKIQAMINRYTSLYQVIGRAIQHEKSYSYR